METEAWGYTNPVVSNLYSKPPLILRDMEMLMVVYETDIENVQRVIPAPLVARTNRVIAYVHKAKLGATQGAFNEMTTYVQVEHDGKRGDYEPFLYVDNHLPLVAGREIWGYQKKMADIDIIHEHEAVRGQVNRLGHQIMKTLVVPEREATLEEVGFSPDGVFSLKYIPPTEEGDEPLRELVLTTAEFGVQEGRLFSGRGSVVFERSEIDPTYLLEPKRIVAGFYGLGDLWLPNGRVVHRY